jgi:hypothetical protein
MSADRVDRIRIATPILFSKPIVPDCNGHSCLFLSSVLANLADEVVDYDELLRLISLDPYGRYWDTDLEAVARAVDASIQVDLESSLKWLKKLSLLFDCDREEPKHEESCLGILFGVLRFANRKQKMGEESLAEVKSILVKTLVNENYMLKRIFTGFCTEQRQREKRKKLKGWLSEAIRAFVDGPYPQSGESRKKEGIEILRSAAQKAVSGPNRIAQTSIGIFLGEQLSFSVFSKMNVWERIKAVAMCFPE